MCVAAHLFQRVGMQRPQTLPASPLSFGSPAHNLTPQRMVSAVPGGEVFGSTSETVQRASLDVVHPHLQTTGSADESLAKSEERQTCGVFK